MPRLDDLLSRPELGLRMVVPGKSSDAELRWVCTTELPDPGPYLGSRELVLTNGLWCTGRAESALFVQRLAEAGSCGLVFGLRESTPRVPDHLVVECERQRMALLDLPTEVPFTAVTRAVATLWAESRQRTLLDTIVRGNALANTVAGGGGLQGVLDLLTRGRDVWAALVDPFGHQLAGRRLDNRDLAAVHAATVARTRRVETSAGPAAVFPVPGEGPSWHDDSIHATLLYGRDPAELDDAERDTIDQVVLFVHIETARQQMIRATELRFSNEVIEMALSGPGRSAELATRLGSFGIDPTGRLAVLAIGLPDEVSVAVADTGVPALVTGFFTGIGMPCVVAAGSGDAVAIVGLSADRSDHPTLATLAARLTDRLGRRLAGRRIAIGIGRVAARDTELRRSLLEAREALRTARARRTGTPIVSFAEPGSHHTLLGLLDEQTRRDFASAVLHAVRDHDLEHATALEHSLAVFLDSGTSWSGAAGRLHVHVNTLRNRMARIEQITGRDLHCINDLVDLHLALRITAGLNQD
ncbi:MAG TPA: PucR family transcriptional regulator ligand-binding domain-containing protein [Mycobacteriales bacterium]